MAIDYNSIINDNDRNRLIRIALNDEIRNRIRDRNVAYVNRMRERMRERMRQRMNDRANNRANDRANDRARNRNNINAERDNNINNNIPMN